MIESRIAKPDIDWDDELFKGRVRLTFAPADIDWDDDLFKGRVRLTLAPVDEADTEKAAAVDAEGQAIAEASFEEEAKDWAAWDAARIPGTHPRDTPLPKHLDAQAKEFAARQLDAWEKAGGKTVLIDPTITGHFTIQQVQARLDEAHKLGDDIYLKREKAESEGKADEVPMKAITGVQFMTSALERIRADGSRGVIAICDGKLVGAIDFFNTGKDVRIGDLGTSNEIKGAGTAILRELATYAAANKLGVLSSFTPPAEKWHALLGRTLSRLNPHSSEWSQSQVSEFAKLGAKAVSDDVFDPDYFGKEAWNPDSDAMRSLLGRFDDTKDWTEFDVNRGRTAAFNALADAQRGAPEQAMVAIQKLPLAKGIVSYLVEHTGDLTQRMAANAEYPSAQRGYDAVGGKIDGLLNTLDHPYGVEKEIAEQLASNRSYNKMDDAQFAKAQDELRKASNAYVDAHNALPVYNRMQDLARAAAVMVGSGHYAGASRALHQIKDVYAQGQQAWVAEASKYDPHYQSRYKEWTREFSGKDWTAYDASRAAGQPKGAPPYKDSDFRSGGDAVPGGYNGYFALPGKGYVDYQTVTDPRYADNTVLIAMVEVQPEARRQGVGMALLERVAKDFPEHKLLFGYTTPEGEALKQAWDKKHPAGAKDWSAFDAARGVVDDAVAAVRNLPSEHLIAISRFGQTVVDKAGVETSTGPHSAEIVPTKAEARKMLDATLVHNHTNGLSFSEGDILTAAQVGAQAIIAVAPDKPNGIGGSGVQYEMRRAGRSWPSLSEIHDAYSTAFTKVTDQLRKDVAANKITAEEGSRVAHDRVWAEVAKQDFMFGAMKYTRTATGVKDWSAFDAARSAGFQPRATLLPVFPGSYTAQAKQYPQDGKPGVTYFKGVISPKSHVDCLLHYSKDGKLDGILNHYPKNMGPERKGNINVLVHPDAQRQGIGSALLKEADKRWNVDYTKQGYTHQGAALIAHHLGTTAWKPPPTMLATAHEHEDGTIHSHTEIHNRPNGGLDITTDEAKPHVHTYETYNEDGTSTLRSSGPNVSQHENVAERASSKKDWQPFDEARRSEHGDATSAAIQAVRDKRLATWLQTHIVIGTEQRGGHVEVMERRRGDFTPKQATNYVAMMKDTNPTRLAELAKAMVTQDIAVRTGLPTATVGEFMQGWSESSSESERSLAMQAAAREMFNTPISSTGYDVVAGAEWLKDPKYSEYAAGASDVVKAMYDSTQADLKAAGIKELTVSRGIALEDPIGGGVTSGRSAPVDYASNPMSSWSTDPKLARGFAREASQDFPLAYVLTSRVPAKDVLALPSTGVGCWEEQEVVLLGRKETTRVEMLR